MCFHLNCKQQCKSIKIVKDFYWNVQKKPFTLTHRKNALNQVIVDRVQKNKCSQWCQSAAMFWGIFYYSVFVFVVSSGMYIFDSYCAQSHFELRDLCVQFLWSSLSSLLWIEAAPPEKRHECVFKYLRRRIKMFVIFCLTPF